MAHRNLALCLQEPVIGSYSKPDEFNPHFTVVFLQDLFDYYPRIYACVTTVSVTAVIIVLYQQ
jgi:hypothetical protein